MLNIKIFNILNILIWRGTTRKWINHNLCRAKAFELNRRNSISLNNTVNVDCTTDRNNHVCDHGPVKECNDKLLSYYNITITTKSKRPWNIVRRYQKRDENNDRKRHGQTQFTNTDDRKPKRINTKSEQKPDMNSCIPEG